MKVYSYPTFDVQCPFCETPFRARCAYLLAWRTKSCGCMQKNVVRKLMTTHGKRKWPEYNTWSGMWQRITNPKHPKYKDYGGRGITIHPEWARFENFLRDMGKRPTNTSLDRIKNNEGYEMLNCRWATPMQQNNNRRNVHV